jgi:hypothetical protein
MNSMTPITRPCQAHGAAMTLAVDVFHEQANRQDRLTALAIAGSHFEVAINTDDELRCGRMKGFACPTAW